MKRNKRIIIGLFLILMLAVVGCESTKVTKNEVIIEDKNNSKAEDIVDKVENGEEDIKDEISKDTGKSVIELPKESIEEGKKLPDFKLSSLEGEEVSLSDYEGKIVFINFWATWCGFCDEEMPDLQRLSDENDDLVILGVNVAEEPPLVRKYIDEGGYDFEILLDEKGELAMEYLALGLPTTHFVNKEGISLGQISGMLTYEQMSEILEDIRNNQ